MKHLSKFNEMAYSAYDKEYDILPKKILQSIAKKLNYKRFTRIGSGRYGTAFKVKGNRVVKITKDLKEYEYAKKLKGLKNKHIADVYETYHFKYNNEKYAIIIKEFCDVSEERMDRMIDYFLDYTKGDMSLSYISSEFLSGDISKKVLDVYFEEYKKNNAPFDLDDWYNMLIELKQKNIYISDFNGSNVGYKGDYGNDICVIELGLGYWNNIKFDEKEEIVV